VVQARSCTGLQRASVPPWRRRRIDSTIRSSRAAALAAVVTQRITDVISVAVRMCLAISTEQYGALH